MAYAFDPIPAKLDPKYHDKVIGTGCHMWSEWVPTNGQMHFQVFPRIAAYMLKNYGSICWWNIRKSIREFIIEKYRLTCIM